MKKIAKILILVGVVGTAFIGGMVYQRIADDGIIVDIEQAAISACEMKVADIKKACK